MTILDIFFYLVLVLILFLYFKEFVHFIHIDKHIVINLFVTFLWFPFNIYRIFSNDLNFISILIICFFKNVFWNNVRFTYLQESSLCNLRPSSPNINILHNQRTVTKPKKLTLIDTAKMITVSGFLQFFFYYFFFLFHDLIHNPTYLLVMISLVSFNL